MKTDGETVLCPFFGKCDGLAVIDSETGSREFYPNTQHTADTMCQLILEAGVHRLVLGFVPGPAAQKLHAAGVDVRLGSCVCAIEELAQCFDALPAL
jgi:predicted Fe-Mo cluster-binding NifX family protein